MNHMKVRNSRKSLKISEILTVSKFVPEMPLKRQKIRGELRRMVAISTCK
jgi:hypothetical protein